MIDRIFDQGADLLVRLVGKCGASYRGINVYIVCIALPLILLGQTAAISGLLPRR